MSWGVHRRHRWRPTSIVGDPARPSHLGVSTSSGRVGRLRMVPFRLGNHLDARTNGGGDGGVHYEMHGPREREEIAHLGNSTRLWGVQGIR